MPGLEQVPLTADLLHVMRHAARTAVELKEPFISPRAILLALLDDPNVGPAISTVVNREKVLGAGDEGKPAFAHGIEDTLAFKTPDGHATVWLDRDAFTVFIEGAQRVDERYLPKHLAFGLAVQAIHAPGVLASIRVEPGVFADAVYKL